MTIYRSFDIIYLTQKKEKTKNYLENKKVIHSLYIFLKKEK